jgi:hypothetical protein
MIIRSSNTLTLGVRWVSRIALAFAIAGCGGSSEDSSFGSRSGALVEEDTASSAEVPDLVGTSDDAAAAAGSCVSDGDDSDSDDSDGDDSDGDDLDGDDDSESDDADEVDAGDDGVEAADDVEKSAGEESDDSDESDGDDSDDDSDGDDSDGDDCVPVPEVPAADPSTIK